MIAHLLRLPSLAAVLAAAAFSLPAQAGVSWSIGINAPIGPGVQLGTVVSGGRGGYVGVGLPAYALAPVVYAPAPVYGPPPVVYGPPIYAPPVAYAPRPARPVYYAPYRVRPPVYYPAVRAGVVVRPGHPHWRPGPHDGRRDDGRADGRDGRRYPPVAQWQGRGDHNVR